MERHTDLTVDTHRAEVDALRIAAGRVDKGLAKRLKKVNRLEALFAPAEDLFYYVLANDGQKPSDVADVVRDG